MTEHPNVEYARRGYAAFGSGDLATLSELIADDAVWHAQGVGPLSGDYHGRDQVFGFFGRLAEEVRVDVVTDLVRDGVSQGRSPGVDDGAVYLDPVEQALASFEAEMAGLRQDGVTRARQPQRKELLVSAHLQYFSGQRGLALGHFGSVLRLLERLLSLRRKRP